MKLMGMIFSLLLFSFTALAETAMEKTDQYFAALKSREFQKAATYFDSSQLTEFREMMQFYKVLPEKSQKQFVAGFFGSQATIASVEELSNIEFFALFFDAIMKQAERAGTLSFDKLEIIGEVPEGESLAHVVTRNKVAIGDMSLEQMEVVTLRKNNDKWYVMLTGKFKGLPEQLKAAFKHQ